MLKQEEVEREEERLRALARELSDEDRKAFFEAFSKRVKDPDTYAVLNWFFPVGIHHFYLRRWARGLADIGLMLAGIALIAGGAIPLGVLLIGMVVVWELWALFRSQVIVQDWNNRTFRELLKRYGRGIPRSHCPHIPDA